MLVLYNTYKRCKEKIDVQDKKFLSIYTCGPTVYNYAHIGNLRTYVFEDLLIRTLLLTTAPVYHVMNLTDVDDKTIKGAIESNQTLEAFTKKYKEAFFEDCKTLNIRQADAYPAATQHISEMIVMIEKLLQKGYAYQTDDGNIFFSISKFPEYGKLSDLKLSTLKQGASNRLSGDEYEKQSAADFVLWKAYDKQRDGTIFWNSPFGKGRPGWHIECSAMAVDAFGPTVDIHCGGVDNIFPHHENEIAQSQASTQQPFARHWAHAEHLIVGGKKMSKSTGNFYTLRDLLSMGYTGAQIRYLLLSTHYRTQLNFTLEGLESARSTLKRVFDCVQRLHTLTGKDCGKIPPLLERLRSDFFAALCDDLNISVALSVMFDAIRQINTWIDEEQVGALEALEVVNTFTDLDAALGCLPLAPLSEEIPPELTKALQEREAARAKKDWKLADRLRDTIFEQGYVIEDAPTGPILKKR